MRVNTDNINHYNDTGYGNEFHKYRCVSRDCRSPKTIKTCYHAYYENWDSRQCKIVNRNIYADDFKHRWKQRQEYNYPPPLICYNSDGKVSER